MDISDTQLIAKAVLQATCNILALFLLKKEWEMGFFKKFFVLQDCLTSGAI